MNSLINKLENLKVRTVKFILNFKKVYMNNAEFINNAYTKLPKFRWQIFLEVSKF